MSVSEYRLMDILNMSGGGRGGWICILGGLWFWRETEIKTIQTD
jgi:hypothetical protein